MRTWVDLQGRSIKGALLSSGNDAVTLQMENGTTANVPLAKLSAADREFVKEWSKKAAAPKGESSAGEATLVWPESVTANTKDLQITKGEQNETARKFVYQSGSFQFTSNAQLTDTVMTEIAGDFELVNTLFTQLPWGWKPKPRKGEAMFLADIYETERDYIAGGGSDNSSGSSKGNRILTKFRTLGLKRVGERYAFDSKMKSEGNITGLISRLVLGDMNNLEAPWASYGLEDFLENVCYRNGSFVFKNPEGALKDRIEYRRKYGTNTSPGRMITLLHAPWSKIRNDVVQLRLESYLDGLLLVYFFGYLDDDGKGTRLHRYYRAVAQEALAWRNYEESGRTLPQPQPVGTYQERAAELNKIIIGDRTDTQLTNDIVDKFKSIGIKL